MLNVRRALEAQYPDFFRSHRRVALTLSRFLGYLFHEARFERFAQDYPHLRGLDFVEQALNYFDFDLRIADGERQRIPSEGRVIIVANHPIGSLDGLALLNVVRRVRPDVKVVANELLTAIEPLHPVLLPVTNMGDRGTSRNKLRALHAHLDGEGALIIFPAGEVSRLGPRGVRDGHWQSGFARLALRTRSPVLPIHVAGRNSLFFYSLSFLARPLSTVWLVREMFKQSHNRVEARIGRPVPHEVYAGSGFSPQQLAGLFRKHVYRLGAGGKPLFRSVETVAPPENRLFLRQELAAAEKLGTTRDGQEIFLCRMDDAPCVMREIGRLRELTFRTVGEGTGQPRDIDRFDRHYHQLVLWSPGDQEIAGGYRLGDARSILATGIGGLYSATLFRYGKGVEPLLREGLELGRSFVQPRFQSRHSLDYLWWGIGAFLQRYPNYRYLFGPVSVSRLYGSAGIAHLLRYYGTHYDGSELDVSARTPFEFPAELRDELEAAYPGHDLQGEFRELRKRLSERGLPVPALFKHYAQATRPEGVRFTAFNVDASFADCVDAFVIADLECLTPAKRARYLGQETPR